MTGSCIAWLFGQSAPAKAKIKADSPLSVANTEWNSYLGVEDRCFLHTTPVTFTVR